jgi:hypothetical protein
VQYLSAKWWDPPKGQEPHTIVAATLDQLRSSTEARRRQAAADAALMGYDLRAFGIRPERGGDCEEPRFNAAENVIDTIVSMTCKERVLPMAITEGGTTEEQEKTKEFNRIILGILEEGGAYELDYLITDDALTMDAGVVVVVARNGRVEFERGFSFEFAADPSEARYGMRRLRTLYRTHAVDREVLREQFRDPDTGRVPDRINRLIDKATCTDDERKTYGVERASDLLVVHEGWHLRAGPRAKDGGYIQCLREGTLVSEGYESDLFPVVLFYYKEPKAGIWQKSVLAKLAGAQRTFDKTNQKIDESHDLLGVPRVIVGKNGPLTSHLDDEIGPVLKCDDVNQIKEWNAQPIHPDVYTYRNQIPEDMLRFFGVSGMSAQSALPAGMSNASGRALDVFNDSESDRLSTFWKQRQAGWVRLAAVALEVARSIGKDHEGYLVAIEDGKELRVAKLEDFDIAATKRKYRLTVQPTSFLAKKPSAKYRQLSEMRDRGDISPGEFRQHLDLPDVVAVNELETAPENLVDRRIGQLLKTGRTFVIEPFHPHQMIFERGLKAYDLAQLREESEERLQMLRDVIQTAYEWVSGKRGEPWTLPQPGAPVGPGPQGPGMPPGDPAAAVPPAGMMAA